VRPELRGHVADALQEHVVTSVSDHVPISITYDLYSDDIGAETRMVGDAACIHDSRAADDGLAGFVVHKTTWPLLRKVMAELSKGQRREWQQHFETRCDEALQGVHIMLDNWEAQRRRRQGMQSEQSSAAPEAIGDSRQARVDAVSARLSKPSCRWQRSTSPQSGAPRVLMHSMTLRTRRRAGNH